MFRFEGVEDNVLLKGDVMDSSTQCLQAGEVEGELVKAGRGGEVSGRVLELPTSK